MPKINGKPVDPKAYAARLTEAKKTLARTSPEVKRKIAEMYPKISNKDIVKKALSPKAIKKGPMPIASEKKKSGATKVKSPSTATPKAKKPSPSGKTNYGPLPKNPTLNDYLMRGIRPPSKNKPGTRPSDSDVILKGYNDKKTINKYKKGK
jgi:hypothetical protein